MPTTKAPQRSIFAIYFMQYVRVLHLCEAAFGRANRPSCRFVVAYARYAPQKIEKLPSLWHLLATDISNAQTPRTDK
jgi:hypothetical protein